MTNKGNFIEQIMGVSTLVMGSKILSSYTEMGNTFAQHEDSETFATSHAMKDMSIKATLLDEIGWNIPHQNWDKKEQDQDFKAIKKMNINTIVLIRAGLGKWITTPFSTLIGKEDVYYPPVDLVEILLTPADKYRMNFFFGIYDSGKYWQRGLFQKEIDLNLSLIDEVWAKCDKHPSFKGWYLSQEISRRTKNMSRIYAEVGKRAEAVSGNLTAMVSPYIHGMKTDQVMNGGKVLTVREHEEEWNEISGNVKGAMDILAFQDGQVDYGELYDYLAVNEKLVDKYGVKCQTNIESFDRDMPIRFLPIKWGKLLLKLEAARKAGMENAITFEFSHFMSPNPAYLQAGHLYRRHCKHFNI